MRTDTKTLIAAMRVLARDIQSKDGIANAAIAEAADRMAELSRGECICKKCGIRQDSNYPKPEF